MPADDEQCRCGHGREPGTGKIGAAAAGHHGRGASAGLGRRPQRRRGTGAGTEVADSSLGRTRLGAQPSGDLTQAPGEQADVEHVGPVGFLLGGEQVEQKRAQAGIVQDAGTCRLRGLCLPLPWAKTTIPRRFSGTAR